MYLNSYKDGAEYPDSRHIGRHIGKIVVRYERAYCKLEPSDGAFEQAIFFPTNIADDNQICIFKQKPKNETAF